MEIHIGDRVRSYDFGRDRECFIEGVVEGIQRLEGCDRYKIRVQRKVWAGAEVEDPYDGHVFPPVNGTRKLFGGVCDLVERIR